MSRRRGDSRLFTALALRKSVQEMIRAKNDWWVNGQIALGKIVKQSHGTDLVADPVGVDGRNYSGTEGLTGR